MWHLVLLSTYFNLMYMKRIIFPIIILFVFSNLSIIAQDYFIDNFEQAKDKAKKQNKRIFVVFSASWCGPCKAMDKDIFQDKEVISYIDSNFVLIKLMSKNNKKLFRKFKINSIPSFVIMENTEKIILRWKGYSSKKIFLARLNNIPLKNLSIVDLDSLYSLEKNNVVFLNKYYKYLFGLRRFDEAKLIAIRLLINSSDWFSKRNMDLIIKYCEEKEYMDFIINNRDRFVAIYGESEIRGVYFSNYFEKSFYSNKTDDYPDLNSIKKDLIDIFGDKYEYFYDFYLMKLLRNKSEYRNIYMYHTIHFFKMSENLFKTNNFYFVLRDLILKLKTIGEYREMYNAFLHQFNYKDTYLEFYNLKAFLEYKLDMKDKSINTLEIADKISKDKYNKSFNSSLGILLELEQLYN